MATMTAAQQRAQARTEYNAFLAECPSRKLLELVSDKWATLILCALSGGPRPAGPDPVSAVGAAGPTAEGQPASPASPADPQSMRFSELSRMLAGVSQKMLTQTLRSLERDGLITRTVTLTVPVTVRYDLTPLGWYEARQA